MNASFPLISLLGFVRLLCDSRVCIEWSVTHWEFCVELGGDHDEEGSVSAGGCCAADPRAAE